VRVTRETQEKTRQAIVEAAQRRFAETGFHQATTREIARTAGIAAGTLFNYFPSKEALGLAILAAAAEAGAAEFEASRRSGETLEEAMFALVAIQLRYFEPYRGWVGDVMDAGWSPLRKGSDEGEGGASRLRQLERVETLLREHGVTASDSPVDEHLYWTLYLGTLSFWARDDTEHQQATLALLDRSMGLYCGSLRERTH